MILQCLILLYLRHTDPTRALPDIWNQNMLLAFYPTTRRAASLFPHVYSSHEGTLEEQQNIGRVPLLPTRLYRRDLHYLIRTCPMPESSTYQPTVSCQRSYCHWFSCSSETTSLHTCIKCLLGQQPTRKPFTKSSGRSDELFGPLGKTLQSQTSNGSIFQWDVQMPGNCPSIPSQSMIITLKLLLTSF